MAEHRTHRKVESIAVAVGQILDNRVHAKGPAAACKVDARGASLLMDMERNLALTGATFVTCLDSTNAELDVFVGMRSGLMPGVEQFERNSLRYDPRLQNLPRLTTKNVFWTERAKFIAEQNCRALKPLQGQ